MGRAELGRAGKQVKVRERWSKAEGGIQTGGAKRRRRDAAGRAAIDAREKGNWARRWSLWSRLTSCIWLGTRATSVLYKN